MRCPCEDKTAGAAKGRSNTLCSSVSSTVSLLAFSAMALLAVLEFFVYRETWMKYEYSVDKDFSR